MVGNAFLPEIGATTFQKALPCFGKGCFRKEVSNLILLRIIFLVSIFIEKIIFKLAYK